MSVHSEIDQTLRQSGQTTLPSDMGKQKRIAQNIKKNQDWSWQDNKLILEK